MDIRTLILETHSITDLKKFYSEILELDIEAGDNNSITFKAGTTDIKFLKSEFENDKPFYHFAFNIPENQFLNAKEWISSKVELIKLNGEDEFDFKNWNAHSVYFYDTAGNIIELIARHNLKNGSDEKFSGKSLLNISEVGFPVKDVRKFYTNLKESFDIPVFSGDLKTFTAAGDENGLFIIVPEGRKWFPDCPEAQIYPAEVNIISIQETVFKNNGYKITSSGKSHL